MNISNILQTAFKNNIRSFLDYGYIIKFCESLMFFIVSYTMPLISYNYLSNISNNLYINSLSYNIYISMYYCPAVIVLYSLHHSKLIKLLNKRYIIQTNPNHTYVTIFYSFIYILLALIAAIINNYYITYICESIGYCIYFSDVAYLYNTNNNYTNKIDFFNSNCTIFIIYSIIVTYIIGLIPLEFNLPASFFICSIFLNSLVNIKYSMPKGNPRNFNILHIFEKIFNILIYPLVKILIYYCDNRVVQF